MPAREYDCKVIGIIWQTPTVFSLRFEPSKRFSFVPGQFLSVVIPGSGQESSRDLRRIYSFGTPSRNEGYELCVQKVAGGLGSSYLASLRPGDQFRISAPYGDFLFGTSSLRNVCFVATGTGIAPFKAMVLSDKFRKNPPAGALLVFGGRTENDILFPLLFEKNGVEVVHALSRPSMNWTGFKGRVTDFFQSLPESWAWQDTDFYLCGNGHMIQDVRKHLMSVRNVPARAIRQEAYFSTHMPVAAEAEEVEIKKAA